MTQNAAEKQPTNLYRPKAIFIAPHLHLRLKRIATDTGGSIQGCAEKAVEQWVIKQEAQTTTK